MRRLIMQIPLLDLKAQYLAIKADVDAAVAEVLESQHFILGPKVEECEKAIARYINSEHAVGMSSGSDALLACLMAENIGQGDEVITTPYTLSATAGAIARVGAIPVFVDIDPATCNLDPAQIQARITNRTRAIIPVHLYGQMAKMTAVMQVAGEHNLVVIEDAAQAIGTEHGGRRAGSIGHYGCFSFFPSKNLGAAGEGGMVVTNDTLRAEKLRWLRAHGAKPRYFHRMVSGNFHLDALQAAIILAKLRHLDRWTVARQRNANRYDELFSTAGLTSGGNDAAQIALPHVVTDRHIFNQYVIRSSWRNELQAHLQRKGVATEVYYPLSLHLQDCFAYLGHKPGDFPESERAARDTLALPVHPELTVAQSQYVVECVREFLVENRSADAWQEPAVSDPQKSVREVPILQDQRRETIHASSNVGFGNPVGVPSSDFKKALGKFPSGVTVVTVKVGGVTRGMTVSAFFSLSMEPPLVAVAVHRK